MAAANRSRAIACTAFSIQVPPYAPCPWRQSTNWPFALSMNMTTQLPRLLVFRRGNGIGDFAPARQLHEQEVARRT